MDYAYNVRGWLTDINDVTDTTPDKLFNFGINYNTVAHGGTPLFNGNIAETEWETANDNTLRWYGYGYDALNRITGATGGPASSYDVSNITYDRNGNMTSDANKGIAAGGVEYNHLNMPTKITVSSGSNTGVLDYVYTAYGTKLQKKKIQDAVPTITDYAGNYVYEGGSLKQISFTEGYVEPEESSWQYVYYLKDHQGNTRVTYSDDNGNGSIDPNTELRREQNYYPFGMEHKGYNGSIYGVKNNLKTFQDQEFTEDLELNIHEWRYRISDPSIGRFWQSDPLGDKYRFNSPYAFAENRVINGLELEGLEYASYSYNGRYQEIISKGSAQVSREERDEANSMKMDVIPGLGDAKGLVEAFTGNDLVTGEKLSGFSRLLGLVFLSEFRSAGKIADSFRGLKVAGKAGDLTGFEKTAADALKSRGDQIIGNGDLGVREALGLGKDGKVSDFLSVSESGKFNITEVKGSLGSSGADVGSALQQLDNTVSALKNSVNGAKIGTLEIAIPKGGKLGQGYSVSGNQLVRTTDEGTNVVRVQGNVVNVRYLED